MTESTNLEETRNPKDEWWSFDLKVTSHPLEAYHLRQEVTLQVLIKSEAYRDEKTKFAIYSVQRSDSDEDAARSFTIKGSFVEPLEIGRTYQVQGIVTQYKEERQLQVKSHFEVCPMGREGTIAFLRTLHGLKDRAYDIYKVFGEDSFSILLNEPERVAQKIRGIGPKSVKHWKEQLKSVSKEQQSIGVLISWGLSMKDAKELLKNYGEETLSVLKRQPYSILQQRPSIGFSFCDHFARLHSDISFRSDERLEQALLHTLKRLTYFGEHVYLTYDHWMEQTASLLTFNLTKSDVKSLIDASEPAAYINVSWGNDMFQVPSGHLEQFLTLSTAKTFTVQTIYADELHEPMTRLIERGIVIQEEQRFYLEVLASAENHVAETIIRRSSFTPIEDVNVADVIHAYLDEHHIQLEPEQYQAVLDICSHESGTYIVTGGAGCGKTFLLRVVLHVQERIRQAQAEQVSRRPFLQEREQGEKILITSPTGRAAKVAARATGYPTSTIHRALGWTGTDFLYNEENPFLHDVFFVDEFSMVDLILFSSLLHAIPDERQLILIGDFNQLESVRCGRVLGDLLESGAVRVHHLKTGKRQLSDSTITANAHRVLNGDMIVNCAADKQDFFILPAHSFADAHSLLIRSILRLHQRFSPHDIQILTPTWDGALGIYRLNHLIQEQLNPTPHEHEVLARSFHVQEGQQTQSFHLFFRPGDRVMNITNIARPLHQWDGKTAKWEVIDTSFSVSNGDIGHIQDIVMVQDEGSTKDYRRILVAYDEGVVFYNESEQEFDLLKHAYVISIHKAQGSQWPAVLMVLGRQHTRMLRNNLFYTGLTRPEEFFGIIAESGTIEQAIRNQRRHSRASYLLPKLQTFVASMTKTPPST